MTLFGPRGLNPGPSMAFSIGVLKTWPGSGQEVQRTLSLSFSQLSLFSASLHDQTWPTSFPENTLNTESYVTSFYGKVL